MTHIQTIQQQMALTRAQVIKCLRWTEEQHFDFVHKMGVQYLREFVPDNDAILEQLKSSRMFWGFWKNEWHRRDLVFMEDANGYTADYNCELYRMVHNAHWLHNELSPGRIEMEDGYCSMITQLMATL